MKVILVDGDNFDRQLVGKYLARDLPEAAVIEYDPKEQGWPGSDFKWDRFHVALVGYARGIDESFLAPLQSAADTDVPVTILLTDTDDEYVAVKVRQLGVDDYLNKNGLVGPRLAKAIRGALDRRARGESRRQSDVWTHLAESRDARDARKASKKKQTEEPQRPRIPGYRVNALIGKGARSFVYLGEREGGQNIVVLKVIDVDFSTNHSHVQRFVHEAEILSALHSPYVVRVYEHGFTDDWAFISMEFFPRGDLKQRIAIGLSAGDAINCTANIAYGLDAIHSMGLVHRDLKPANVMFRHDDTLALVDFGIVKRAGERSERSTTGSIFGTPNYMAPEQAKGRPADTRNDLYSLGVMLYEMLTGRKPFKAETPADLVHAHINLPIPRLPNELRRYQSLLDRLMAKDPAGRFQTAVELINAL
jgi:tRNA A-37 threonylcarbamoyl transferase component Bud32/DNA-binding response OmpR family regulator